MPAFLEESRCVSRRAALQVGTGLFGLNLPSLLAAAQLSGRKPSDVNGIDDDQWPEGMNHIGDLPHLTVELLHRGYSAEQLRKTYSDNLRRVYDQALPSE